MVLCVSFYPHDRMAAWELWPNIMTHCIMYPLARDKIKIQSMVSTECTMHICFCKIVYGTVIKS